MDSLRKEIEDDISTKKATIGVGIYDLESGDTLTVSGSKHYPMQSVFKFHLALALLAEVDSQKRNLNDLIPILKKNLHKETLSPLRDKNPNGNYSLTLAELLRYMVSESDNNACDILFKVYGGTKKTEQFIKNLGINDISIKATEYEMHGPFRVQYTNWTTPYAAILLLKKFNDGHIISKSNSDFLLNTMTNSNNPGDRLKAGLPKDAKLAHKTGTSGHEKGMQAALNDIGIVTLPNGNHYAIAVFVSNSLESDAENARIIAAISKLAWKYFSGQR
ncbi:MAG TPA: class A beta-lactamase, subclass A2 [Candidatus Kapabacteria bacterium]|nr:class A beta-lactamase, subclass A2 [Candidatus Kapabacteria bacterium]